MGAAMQFRFTPEQDAWREEVRAFLDAELPPEKAFDTEFCEDQDLWDFAFDFTRKVGEKGWIGLTWPVEYGGLGRPVMDRLIMFEEFAYREAPLVNQIGWGLAAGSLLVGGTDEQKRRFLPAIARFENMWAEGLTEPDAGSDLATLTTRAHRDGDDWIVNGQKTYTTWGHHCDVMYLAARTEPDAPKHRGISIFCVDLSAPGISMSPLYNLGGGRQNHTYFDDVRIPGDALIGEPGQGWTYIMSAFYHSAGAGSHHTKMQRMLDKALVHCRTARRGSTLLIDDPLVRSHIAEMVLMIESERLLAYEGVANVTSGRAPAYAGALGVVVSKENMLRFSELMNEIVGPMSVFAEGSRWAPVDGEIEAWYRQSYANHAGGTSQVKRMVLATRGLGLPR